MNANLITNVSFPPNVSVVFEERTFTMRVSLCVPKELIDFLPKNRCRKTYRGKHIFYLIRTEPTAHFSPSYAYTLYTEMLRSLKISVRLAKSTMYKLQADLL